ncbi:hypothetical protein O3P69_003399 [Scylla paramamosain]|uniref:Uncharacterized protein n=1 Tax=Scylla paramamosain TaxID=85552 RepID=A0AAW0UGI4_SCYPA
MQHSQSAHKNCSSRVLPDTSSDTEQHYTVAMRQVCGGTAHQLLRKTVTAELRRLHHEGVIAQSGEEYGHCVSAPQSASQDYLHFITDSPGNDEYSSSDRDSLMALVLFVVFLARLMTSASIPPSFTTTPPPLAKPSADLLALSKDYWNWKTQEFPQFSTQLGINDDTAARLDSYDKQRLQKRKAGDSYWSSHSQSRQPLQHAPLATLNHAKCEEFLQRANKIDTTSLSTEDLITLKVFKEEMNTYVQNFPYKKYYAPVTFMSGPQESLRYMVEKEVVLDSYNDYEKLLSRYSDFPRQAQEILTLLRENIKDNIMPSNWSMVGVMDRFDSLIGPVEDSLFYKPFVNMSDTITAEQRTTLRQQAQERIKQDLIPSFKEIRNFIENQYLPATRTEVGASSLPGGEAYYQACLKFHTTTDLTPQQIHDLGQKEVARIEAEVQKVNIKL